MAEKTVIEPRTIFKIAQDLDDVSEYFRVTQDLLIDQLCAYNVSDEKSMNQSLERIHFLINLIPEKLTHMTALNAELYSLDKDQKLDVIAS